MSHKFSHRLISLFLALAIPFAGVASALAADGTLDPTFGKDGKVITDFGGNDDHGGDVTLQPDGKIVVAGQSHNGINNDFALARYNSDGSLDPTFDMDGKVTTDFSNNDDIGGRIALQPDGKIMVAGITDNGSNYDLALARYNSDGSLDPTFDTDGKLITNFGDSDEFVTAIFLQVDNKIVIAGSNYSGNHFDFALARYNSDGSLDTTFGVGGKVITDFGSGNDYSSAAALQLDDKIVVAGQSYNGSNYDFALARYNMDGSLDVTFDMDGKVITDFVNSDEHGTAVALQPDSRIVLAGVTYNDIYGDFALARYNSDGSLDTTFDTDGRVSTDFGDSFEFLSAMTLQPEGKIIVAGNTRNGSNNDFALARYNSDGSLDEIFDSDGKVTTDFGSSDDFGAAIVLQPNGKLIVAGDSSSDFNFGNYDFALARYDVATSAMEVTIDVKPGRFPNRIALEKKVCKDDDNLYVAFLTTPDFDALTVDSSSLTLGDPNLNGTVTPVRNRANDADGDGDMDMVLTFPLCNLVTNGALNTSSTELVLTGMTLDGVSIMGKDSVKVMRDD